MKSIVVALFLIRTAALAQGLGHSPAEVWETKTVASLLASPEPAQVAWGAHLAGNYGLKQLGNDLLPLAVSPNWGVRMTAIDSIVRLDLDVPEETLTRMTDSNMDAVLILIARTRARVPDAYGRLIADLLGRKLDDEYWVALNGILLSKPPSGFAARLIEDWTIHTVVIVADPDRGAGFGFGSGGGVGCFGPSALPGFPPILAYRVHESPKPGDVLLAGGPHPVGYRREDPSSRAFGSVDREQYRWDYLASLAGTDDSKAHLTWFGKLSQPRIWWKDDSAYRDDANELMQSIRLAIRSVKSQLIQRELLTSEESTLLPKFVVEVRDQRKSPARPLPDVRWSLGEGSF
jgi:hypothetical protein